MVSTIVVERQFQRSGVDSESEFTGSATGRRLSTVTSVLFHLGGSSDYRIIDNKIKDMFVTN